MSGFYTPLHNQQNILTMFSFFKKKSKKEKLEAKHAKLMEEAYKLSHTDRAASSAKYAEADEVQKELMKLAEIEAQKK